MRISGLKTRFLDLRNWFAVRWAAVSRRQRRTGRVAIGCVSAFLLFLLLDGVFPLPAPIPYSVTVYDAKGGLLCAYLTPDDKWRLRTRHASITRDMTEAILHKEDRWFHWHPGINPVALCRALIMNVFSGRRTSGASTITMQLARMSEPAHRTYLRKLREMFRALQYELHYSKDEILGMYLSRLPYGGNIEGVQAAAWLYFGRSPQVLSLSQSVLLAVVPNRPNSLRLDRSPEAAREMRDRWLRRYLADGVFDKATIEAALNEPVPALRYALPMQTPQFCQYVAALQERSVVEAEPEVKTWLQPDKQRVASELLSAHVRRVQPQGISNGALMVVHNPTHRVVAYCGSADFHDNVNGGQIDGVHALRSPGSSLKPVAYALAFDQGKLTPEMRLLDVPTTYRGFSPENYHPGYAGQVTVRKALATSLNIPVVRVVNDVITLDAYLNLLTDAGFESVKKQRTKLGLSSVTGGCGVTLEEMTRLFATFANGGKWQTLSYLRGVPEKSEQKQLFSPGATWMIADILSGLERPDLPASYIEEGRLPKVAWKTGTSYGRRDAWAVGFSPEYTIAVWMGNFDNSGAPELSGTATAVPLLIDLFNSLAYDPMRKWFPMPQDVYRRQVCAETGMPPAASCTRFTQDVALQHVSSLSPCDLYQQVYVNEAGTMRYCPSCLPPDGWVQRSYPMQPAELVLWFGQNHLPVHTAPPHNSECTTLANGSGPRILSPLPDYEYFVEIGREQQITFQAAAPPGTAKLYWYANGRYLTAAPPDEKVFFTPKLGKLQVSCVDDQGRKSSVTVSVKGY